MGILAIILSEYVCFLYYQASHRMCDEYEGTLSNRYTIIRKPIGEHQHLKEKVFSKVDDVKVRSGALKIRVVPIGENPR